MDKDPRLKGSIVEDIRKIMPGRDEESLENIADDILELTEDLEDEDRIRKIVLGELIFVSNQSSKRIIDLSQDLADKILEYRK